MIKWWLAIVYVSGWMISTGIAQSSSPVDSSSNSPPTLAASHREQGRTLRRNRQFDQALAHYDTALHLFESLNDSLEIAVIHYNIGNVYHDTYDFQQALDHYGQAVPVFRKRAEYTHLAKALNNTGNVYLSMGNYPEAHAYYRQILEAKSGLTDAHMVALACNNLALISRIFGNYAQSLAYHNRAIALEKELQDQKGLATSYANIGNLYDEWGDQEKALEYLFQSMAIFETIPDPLGKAYALNSIALIYAQQKNYTLALSHHQQALAIRRAQKERMETGISLLNLGILYDEMNQAEQAIDYHLKALAAFESIADKNNVGYVYNSLGTLYKGQQSWEQAFRYQQRAVSIFREMEDREGEILTLHEMGSLHLIQKQFQKSMEYYREAAAIAAHTEVDPGDMCHPLTYSEIRLPMELLESLTQQADIYYRLAQMKNSFSDCDTPWLALAWQSYRQALELTGTIRKRYASETAHAQLSEKIRPLLEQALTVATDLYLQTGKQEYAEAGFIMMERSKSLLLLDGLHRAKAAASVPALSDSLGDQLRTLAAKLHFWELEVDKARTNSRPDNDLATLQTTLFSLRQQYEAQLANLQKHAPRYAQFRFGEELTATQDISHLLNSDEVLIEYFTGDSTWFIFASSRQQDTLIRIPVSSEIQDTLLALRSAIQETSFTTDRIQAYQDFTHSAFALYQKLITPIRPLLSGKQKLIIAPDGILSMIPFDMLIAGLPVGDQLSYKRLDYLLHEYEVQYIPSATLWKFLGGIQPADTNPPEPRFLAFAPFKVSTVPGVRALPGSIQEISTLTSHWRGDIFSNQEASKQRFQKIAKNYPIIHLSTHGRADTQDIRYSHLLFASDKLPDGYDRLFTHELYAMDLAAELVVLSTCESGMGLWYEGEGVMSLGRGFIYAGASSVVMSLWPVNEGATQEILRFFYQYLAAGKTKSESLTLAKRSYLSACKADEALPFYWAGWVINGNDAPVEVSAKNGIGIWMIGLLVAGVFGIIYMYSRRSTSV